MVKRIESGIPGLDEVLGGGFPHPSTVLVSGEPGTGKTTLAVQSLFYGAAHGDKGLYITTIAEPVESVQSFLRDFSFYRKEVIDKRQVVFEDVGDVIRRAPEEVPNAIRKLIEKTKPRRIVIDPVSTIRDSRAGPIGFREFLYDFIQMTKEYQTLNVIVCEIIRGDIAKYPESYIVDGLLSLTLTSEGIHRYRDLFIVKMRGTTHSLDTLRYEISTNGVKVLGPPI